MSFLRHFVWFSFIPYPVSFRLSHFQFYFFKVPLFIVIRWGKKRWKIYFILSFFFNLNGKFLQIGTVKLCYILELIRKQGSEQDLSIDNNSYVTRSYISHLSPLVAACRCDNTKYTVHSPSPLLFSFSLFLFFLPLPLSSFPIFRSLSVIIQSRLPPRFRPSSLDARCPPAKSY